MEEGQKLRVTVVHPSGRRTFDPVAKEHLIAACLEPGASVAKLALEHGVNANLVWKWIRQHRFAKKETVAIAPPSTPAFIPVQIEGTPDRAMSRQDSAAVQDLRPNDPGVQLSELERTSPLSSPAKVNASLPNGLQLTLECGDVRAVMAIVGALCDVQTGR
ncbi:transposase [Bradyrhizobium sp. 6(2017)]